MKRRQFLSSAAAAVIPWRVRVLSETVDVDHPPDVMLERLVRFDGYSIAGFDFDAFAYAPAIVLRGDGMFTVRPILPGGVIVTGEDLRIADPQRRIGRLVQASPHRGQVVLDVAPTGRRYDPLELV